MNHERNKVGLILMILSVVNISTLEKTFNGITNKLNSLVNLLKNIPFRFCDFYTFIDLFTLLKQFKFVNSFNSH